MRPSVKLTPEQKALVRGVPGLADRAAADAARRFGNIRPRNEMVASAHYGIAMAAQTFDPKVGKSFEDWAYYKAFWTILDDARAERSQAKVIALARMAWVEYVSRAQRSHDDDDTHNTEENDRAALDVYMGGMLAAIRKGVASMPVASGGEDDMIARLDAAKAAAALKSVYDGLQPHQLELLRCECEADFQALAPKWGKSWWTLARAAAKLHQIVGARLAGKGVDEMPVWNDESWRVVAGASATGSPHEGAEP